MIDQIYVTNFKSIKELKLYLNPVNILIGANGAGKSNFISLFKLLRSLQRGNLNTYVAEQGYMDNLMYFGQRELESIKGHITFKNPNDFPTNRYIYELRADNNNKAFIKVEKSGYNKGNRENPDWDYNSSLQNSERSLFLEEGGSYRDRYLKDYFNEFYVYHFHDTSSNSPLKRTSDINDNQYLREDGGNLPAFLFYLQTQFPKHLKRIEKVITSIASFFGGFNLQPDRLNKNYIKLEWKERGFDRYQNANNLSDGTLRFIALTTLMLQPHPPKTIIIDEPELGLHPFAINKLAGLIKKISAKSQIIISTQSVNLINNFVAEDIITVDRENQQSKFKKQNSANLAVWLKDYSMGDLWDKSVIGGQP